MCYIHWYKIEVSYQTNGFSFSKQESGDNSVHSLKQQNIAIQVYFWTTICSFMNEWRILSL